MMNYTKFQKYILREVDENAAEFSILMPAFKEDQLKEEVFVPYFDYKSNYEINDLDFEELKRQVLEVIEKENLKFVKCMSNSDDYYLRKSEYEKLLSDKKNWNYYEGDNINNKALYLIVEN